LTGADDWGSARAEADMLCSPEYALNSITFAYAGRNEVQARA